MHATVATWSPVDHVTTVVTDDGTRLTAPARAFDASGLLRLHPGQRVRLSLEDAASDHAAADTGPRVTDLRITTLTIATLPLPHPGARP